MRILKKSRQLEDFLKNHLPGSRPVIALHDNPDPDALAASWALKVLFEKSYNIKTTIAYDGVIGRAENRHLVSECQIPIKKIRQIKLQDHDFFITADTQPGAGNVFLNADSKVHMVIDHHPRRSTTRNIPWVDIRPHYGASGTICLEYLLAHGIEPDKKLATALLYALKSETQDLGREAGPADRRAYFYLSPLADYDILFNVVHAKVPLDYYRMLAVAFDQAKTYNDVLVVFLGDVSAPEYAAEVADMLLRLKGINWVLAAGRYKNETYLSIRTILRSENAGEIMRTVVDGIGNGGGHEMMAGGRVSLPENEKNFDALDEEMGKRFLKALRKRSSGSELLET